jgi:hypothetical protein
MVRVPFHNFGEGTVGIVSLDGGDMGEKLGTVQPHPVERGQWELVTCR